MHHLRMGSSALWLVVPTGHHLIVYFTDLAQHFIRSVAALEERFVFIQNKQECRKRLPTTMDGLHAFSISLLGGMGIHTQTLSLGLMWLSRSQRSCRLGSTRCCFVRSRTSWRASSPRGEIEAVSWLPLSSPEWRGAWR